MRRTPPAHLVLGALGFIVPGLVVRAPAQPARTEGGTGAALSGQVTVFAAASLTAAFQALAVEFEARHPGLRVQFNFASSSTLAHQIQQGAPADVFASADETNLQALAERGALAEGMQFFAGNLLQIVVPAGNPRRLASLADLTAPDLAIALCGPTVPCGRYAAAAFARAGIAVPAASQELDVKAVLNKVALGEADAGIVYATDVRAAGAKVQGIDLPGGVKVVARYPLAVLQAAPNRPAADAFAAFVVSPAAQRILTGFGFLVP